MDISDWYSARVSDTEKSARRVNPRKSVREVVSIVDTYQSARKYKRGWKMRKCIQGTGTPPKERLSSNSEAIEMMRSECKVEA